MSKKKQTNVTEAEENVAADQHEQSVPEVPVVDEAETETASEESVPVVTLEGDELVARGDGVRTRDIQLGKLGTRGVTGSDSR